MPPVIHRNASFCRSDSPFFQMARLSRSQLCSLKNTQRALSVFFMIG
ncbi:hypothetical protein BCBMB205_06310 [Bacillus sp. CN2]|nr:hypothetical protein BCBMB205_06310 [Bacillus velezensis]ARZ56957.1 hypothetical protein BAGQ_0702 [Bacillus velezensis]GFR57146.1 hypothetical protein BCBMB205_06310 [Bacillus sp. CN2]